MKKIGYMPQIGKYPENMTIGQTIKMIQDNRKNVENIDTELLEAFELQNCMTKNEYTFWWNYPKSKCCFSIYVSS